MLSIIPQPERFTGIDYTNSLILAYNYSYVKTNPVQPLLIIAESSLRYPADTARSKRAAAGQKWAVFLILLAFCGLMCYTVFHKMTVRHRLNSGTDSDFPEKTAIYKECHK